MTTFRKDPKIYRDISDILTKAQVEIAKRDVNIQQVVL